MTLLIYRTFFLLKIKKYFLLLLKRIVVKNYDLVYGLFKQYIYIYISRQKQVLDERSLDPLRRVDMACNVC